MKLHHCFFAIFLLASGRPASAQTTKEQAEARAIYAQSNRPPAAVTLRDGLKTQTTGFLGDGTFQVGALRTFDGRYRPVPGLRFHAGMRLLEARDSINTDSTHLWPVGSLRGFDIGEMGGTGTDALRRFRPRLVKEGSAGTRREFVEVLTAVDAGPLLLTRLYSSGADAAAGRLSMAPILLVGVGNEPTEPLHPIILNQTDVLRLFGKRVGEISTFVNTQHLQYDQPTDVAKMIDRYNRVAVVK